MTDNGIHDTHLHDPHNLAVCVEQLSQDNSQDDDIELKMDVEFEDDDEIDFTLPMKQILLAMNQAICHRLDSMDHQLDNLNQYCQHLEQKMEDISANVRDHNLQINSKRSGQTVVVGLSPNSSTSALSQTTSFTTTVGPNLTTIRLNTENDYPNGSWLGEEANPELRVRCEITSSNLLHINTTCPTPEKMALTLLDHLFPRDVQACSNISGVGKHKKKQLDPLLVFGIRCHLVHKFGITEKDWHRIKQNMDSKCRTAFRRKQKGLPVMDSENETSMDRISDSGETTDLDQSQAITLQAGTIGVVEEGDLSNVMQGAQVIHTTEGDIQVLHATPEQIAQIQQTHQIQILTSDHLITTTEGQIIQHISDSETSHLLHDEDTREVLNEDI